MFEYRAGGENEHIISEEKRARMQALVDDLNGRRDVPNMTVHFCSKPNLENYICDKTMYGPYDLFEIWFKHNGTCRVRLSKELVEAIGGYDYVTELVEAYGRHKMTSAGVFECESKIEIVGKNDDRKVRIDKLSDGGCANLLYRVISELQADDKQETKTA